MVNKTIICDVCKKEIKDKPVYLTVSEFAPTIFLGVTSLEPHARIYEVCKTCMDAVYDAWGKIK